MFTHLHDQYLRWWDNHVWVWVVLVVAALLLLASDYIASWKKRDKK